MRSLSSLEGLSPTVFLVLSNAPLERQVSGCLQMAEKMSEIPWVADEKFLQGQSRASKAEPEGDNWGLEMDSQPAFF